MVRLAFVAFVLLNLVSCGSSEVSQPNIDEQNPALFVVMSGFSTCGRDSQGNDFSPYRSSLFQRFERYVNEHPGEGLDFLVSCYGRGEEIAYANSLNPKDIRLGGYEEFSIDTQTLMDRYQDTYVLGHSYGGWLAMKLGLARARDDIHLNALVTIDPISRVHCDFNQPFGCQESPQDFNVKEKTQMRQNTNFWSNIYQTTTFYLHASKIPEAHKNIKLQASHTQIDSADETWQEIAHLGDSYVLKELLADNPSN